MKLELSEGRVYGARYYTVKPIFEAHGPTWFRAEWDEMEAWTIQSFGPTPTVGVFEPGARWYINNEQFWFRYEQDLSFFVLRWS